MPEQKPEVPEKYKDLYVQKQGFTNFYFNQLERDRVLKGLLALGDFSQAQGTWKASGTLGEEAVQFTMADKGVGLVPVKKNAEPFFQGIEDGSDFADEPPGSGGLLLAMHHLRKMFTLREKGFSDFYYLGSEPFDGTGETVDVIVAGLTGAESWWYFSQATGQLLGFDLHRTEGVDACEIRVQGFLDVEGRKVPGQFVVKHGDQEFARVLLTKYEFQAKPEPKEEKPPETKPDDAAKDEAKKESDK
jgi:hypothetical protein